MQSTKTMEYTYFVENIIDIGSSFGRGFHEKKTVFLCVQACFLRKPYQENYISGTTKQPRNLTNQLMVYLRKWKVTNPVE